MKPDRHGISHRPRCQRPVGSWLPEESVVPMAYGTRLRVVRCSYCRQTALPDIAATNRSSPDPSGSRDRDAPFALAEPDGSR